jgi:hypothetical protein
MAAPRLKPVVAPLSPDDPDQTRYSIASGLGFDDRRICQGSLQWYAASRSSSWSAAAQIMEQDEVGALAALKEWPRGFCSRWTRTITAASRQGDGETVFSLSSPVPSTPLPVPLSCDACRESA